jgi:hypothetical protein
MNLVTPKVPAKHEQLYNKPASVANVIKLFTDVITSLSAQLSQNHREIRRYWHNYDRKKFIILTTGENLVNCGYLLNLS